MRKNIPFLALLHVTLLIPTPALSISYSGSTLLDFSNFRFSGISIIDRSPLSGVQVQSNDIAGPAGHQGGGAAFFTPWENHTEMNSIPGVVTAVTVAGGLQLSTSVSMSLCCTGTTADPYSSRFGTFIANEAGNLTMAIPFTFTHSGVPTPIIGFSSIATASLSLGGLTTSAQLDAAFGNGSRHGFLSLTRFFGAGETGFFGIETSITAANRTVPLPDMLWPTLLLLLWMAIFVERWSRETQKNSDDKIGQTAD